MSVIFLQMLPPMACLCSMHPSAYPNVVVGIDPGLQTTGWAFISCEGSKVFAIASGSISPAKNIPLGARLLTIENELDKILNEYRPALAGVEKTFVGISVEAAFLLGASRAACLTALARNKVLVEDIAPTQVKKSITGRGRASKEQIGFMVKTLLPASQSQNDHEADAFALALTASWKKDRAA